MERLAMRFAGEWYIQDGFAKFRGPNGELLENEPQFIKTTIEEIKQSAEKVQYMQLKNNCTLEEIGLMVERISPNKFGKKTPLYGVFAPSEQAYRENTMNDIVKLFAEYYKRDAVETKKRQARIAKTMKG